MAGCDAHNLGGDNDAAIHRIERAVAIAAAIVGGLFVLFSGLGLLVALAAAAAAAALMFFIAQAWDWFGRLKEQSPSTITLAGHVKCAGRNPFGIQPWTDGDWTCNLAPTALLAPTDLPVTPGSGAIDQIGEVRLRAAPGSGLAHAFPSFNEVAHTTHILHCEISSHMGAYSVVGGAVGAGVGAALGIGAGIAICAALGIFTFGLGAIACAIVLAIAGAGGAAAGGFAGEAIGSVIGWVVDELSDFDKNGKTIESNQNCLLALTGSWVTDTSHQHNEIHDIESVQIIACPGIDAPPEHPQNRGTVGIVAIGRRAAGDAAPPPLH